MVYCPGTAPHYLSWLTRDTFSELFVNVIRLYITIFSTLCFGCPTDITHFTPTTWIVGSFYYDEIWVLYHLTTEKKQSTLSSINQHSQAIHYLGKKVSKKIQRLDPVSALNIISGPEKPIPGVWARQSHHSVYRRFQVQGSGRYATTTS